MKAARWKWVGDACKPWELGLKQTLTAIWLPGSTFTSGAVWDMEFIGLQRFLRHMRNIWSLTCIIILLSKRNHWLMPISISVYVTFIITLYILVNWRQWYKSVFEHLLPVCRSQHRGHNRGQSYCYCPTEWEEGLLESHTTGKEVKEICSEKETWEVLAMGGWNNNHGIEYNRGNLWISVSVSST